VTGSVALGYDSYSENYSVVRIPALSELNEFRTRLSLGYIAGALFGDYALIEAQSLIGERSLETVGRANLARRFGGTRLALDNVVTFRSYGENTAFTFANDYLRYDLRAQVRRHVTPGLSLALTNRMEIIDFQERTEFDYNYVRNGIELAVDIDRGFTTGYQVALGYIHKMIPDSSEISYDAYTSALEYRHAFGLQRQIFVAIDGERRLYADNTIRSPVWSFYSTATIQPVTVRRFGLTFDNVFESYQYDHATAVFFNYVENRSSLLFTHFNTSRYTIGLGPTYGLLRSGASLQDEYTEIGGKLSIDYNSGGRFWVSASYEPGRRDYKIESINASDMIFSDFVYQRILLFVTLKLWSHANVNAFVNIEPEDHKFQEDDTTTTLFSADLTYRF
jgi:hypothetical protein